MIIGIVGCKRSGKDTVCRIIQAYDIYSAFFAGRGFDTNLDDFIYECLKDETFNKWNLVFGTKWRRQALADKLKQCLSLVTNEPLENFYSEDLKNTKCIFTKDGISWTRRQLLQLLGTEVCRVIDQDFWVKSLFLDYKEGENLIIPDIRYENEATAVKDRDGILIRVNRNDPTFEHSSETGLQNFKDIDYVIDNNKDLRTLIYNTIQCLSSLKI